MSFFMSDFVWIIVCNSLISEYPLMLGLKKKIICGSKFCILKSNRFKTNKIEKLESDAKTKNASTKKGGNCAVG